MLSFEVTCVFAVLLLLLLLLLLKGVAGVVVVRVLFSWKRPNLMLLLMFCEPGISEVGVVVVDDIAVDGGDSLIELNLFSFDWKFNLLSIELWAVGEFVVCSKTGLEVDDNEEEVEEDAVELVDEDETVDDVEPVEDVDLEFKKLFKLVAFLVSEEESVEWPIRLVLWLGGNEWRVLANIFLFLLLPKYFLVWLNWFVLSFEVVDCWHLADLIGLNVYLLLLLSDLNSSRDEVDDDEVVVIVDVDDETVSLVKLLLRDFSSSLLTKLIFSTGANMPWLCLHWKYLEKK